MRARTRLNNRFLFEIYQYLYIYLKRYWNSLLWRSRSLCYIGHFFIIGWII